MKYYTYHVIEMATRLMEAMLRREDSKELEPNKLVDQCTEMAVRAIDNLEVRCAGRDEFEEKE